MFEFGSKNHTLHGNCHRSGRFALSPVVRRGELSIRCRPDPLARMISSVLATSFALTIVSLSAVLCNAQKLFQVLGSAGVMELGGDGYGARTIRAEEVSFNDCGDWDEWPTGTETGVETGMTTLSMFAKPAIGQTPGSNSDCRIRNSTTDGKKSQW